MKLLAVGMRVDKYPDRNEVRDALDENWIRFLEKFGFSVLLVPNSIQNVKKYLGQFNVQGIILPGGNDLKVYNGSDISEERESTEQQMLDYALEKNLPVLGVCRGMQVIADRFGMKIKKVSGHVNVFHKVIATEFTPKEFLKDSVVNSFHNYGLGAEELSSELEPIYLDEQNNIEAFKHVSKNIFGIMWHPERPKENILNNMIIDAAFGGLK